MSGAPGTCSIRTVSAQTSLGTVAVLRRYPVKSMLGEDLPDGEVTMAGLAGDRVRGLVHRETGKIASAKNPRLWRRLLRLHAACSGTAVSITFPGGARLGGGRPRVRAAPAPVLRPPGAPAPPPPPRPTVAPARPYVVP